MDEAHVEHAVGFVEHQDLDLGQVDMALVDQVEQAARGRDQDVHAFLQRVDLRVHADAAEDHGRLELEVLAVALDRFLDLGREFARRCQHQGAHRTGLALDGFRRVCLQAVQHRQREGRGLAGAGLGAGEQVVAREHGGDGLGLDRGRVFVALLAHGFEDDRGQLQFFKCHVVGGASPLRLGHRPFQRPV